MRLFLFGLILSSSVFGFEWGELEQDQTYQLTQSLQLSQKEKSQSILVINKGEQFELEEIVPLEIPGAPLMLYIFNYINCPGTEIESDLEIIAVTATKPSVEIGAEVQRCKLNIYLEFKDVFTKSLFQ